MAHIFTPALRRPLSKPFAKSGTRTLIQRAIASLRARGSDAHLWLPGVGTLNGLTTGNYLESTGNTLATVDNPTGLVLDALGTVGVDILGGTGSFDSGTGWTLGTGWSISGGIASFAGGADANLSYITLPLVVGNTYLVQLSISLVNGSLSVRVGSGAVNDYRYSSSGTFSFYTVADTTSGLALRTESATSGLSIDNISVREVTGIHVQQATTSNKPVLRRGAYNYLLNSVLAGGTSGAIGSGAVAPTSWAFGSSSGAVTFASNAVRFVATAQRPFLFEAVTLPVGTFCLSAKVVSADIPVSVVDLVSASSGTGTVSVSTFKINGVASAGNVSTGDLLSVLVTVTVAGSVNLRFGVGCSGASTGDITLSQPQLETGSTASAYSPTTTAAASNPDEGRYSWSFDGSNDSLLTGNLGITNACTIVIAGRLNSLAATAVFFGEAANGLQIYVAGNGAVYAEQTSVGTLVNSAPAAIVVGVPFVLTMRLSSGTAVLRKNGVQIATAATAYTLSATTGARLGMNFTATLYPVNGSLGNVLAMPLALTDAECLLVERMAASQFPNGPVF